MKASPAPSSTSEVSPPAPGLDLPTSESLPTPPSATPPLTATWPEWFLALDIVLGITALIVAFLAASFAARNSDLWLQLASGRLIAQGNLHLGSDPFSFSGEDRPWVHTTWLNDLGMYAVYSLDTTGVTLVAVKAAIFTVVFALFAFLRRPGHSLWPWAVCAILAILASAPYAHLRPQVLSMLFLSATIVLLYRLPWNENSWRQPAIVAGLFALWANCDVWFFLGPLVVACVLIGEFLNRFLMKEVAEDAESPFWAAPPLQALVKTLLLGVIACLLNPYFLAAVVKSPTEAVAQLLPMELGFGLPVGATEDVELTALTITPLSAEYMDVKYRGQSINGFSFAILLVGGAMSLVMGIRNLRATHIVLWIAFAALSLQHVRLIPFFAIVAVPLVAAHLNGVSGWFRLGTWNDPTTRILLTGTGLVRMLSVLGGFALIGVAYPGWLHGLMPNPALQNRLDWSIEAAPSMVRTANNAARLHAEGELPASVHAMNTSAEFGNYMTWFAPNQKVFVNSRFSFHRHEFPDLVAVRQILVNSKTQREVPKNLKDLSSLSDKYKVGYFILASWLQRVDENGLYEILQKDDEWVLWHLDGRSAVVGRIPADRDLSAVVKRLKFDPIRVAFTPDQEQLPVGKAVYPPLTEREFFDDYVYRPTVSPAELDDAPTYAFYGEYSGYIAGKQWEQKMIASFYQNASVVGPSVFLFNPAPPAVDDVQFAIPVLMTRAARRGIAANPDLPGGYLSLIQAYSQPLAPVLDAPFAGDITERQMQVLTAQVRFLDRLPPPSVCSHYQRMMTLEGSMSIQGSIGSLGSMGLFMTLAQSNQLDWAKVVFERSVACWEKLPKEVHEQYVKSEQLREQNTDPRNRKPSFVAMLKKPDEVLVNLERQIQRATEQVQRGRTAYERFGIATQTGLPLKALELFNDLTEDGKEPGPERNAMLAQSISVLLRGGKLEDAAARLGSLEAQTEEFAAKDPSNQLYVALKQLDGLKCRLEGNFVGAEKALPKSPFKPIIWDAPERTLDAVVGTVSTIAGGTFSGLLASPYTQQNPPSPIVTYVASIHNKRGMLQQESLYNYDRGLLAINMGNMKDAEYWLSQAVKPQGVDLREFGDLQQYARIAKYLELIKRAATPLPK